MVVARCTSKYGFIRDVQVHPDLMRRCAARAPRAAGGRRPQFVLSYLGTPHVTAGPAGVRAAHVRHARLQDGLGLGSGVRVGVRVGVKVGVRLGVRVGVRLRVRVRIRVRLRRRLS